MADHALLSRNPSHPLLSLCLNIFSSSDPSLLLFKLLYTFPACPSPLSSLRRLTIEGYFGLLPFLPTIFSIQSLESLSLMSNFHFLHGQCLIFPSGFKMTFLRSLSLRLFNVDPASLTQLVSELCSLQDLHLETCTIDSLTLSSQTLKRLKLIIRPYFSLLHSLELFLPSLESLHLHKNQSFPSIFHIHGEFPLLKRASIILGQVLGEDVHAVSKLLNYFGHVEELTLSVKESEDAMCPKPILLQPGKNLLKFPNLKHLDVGLCFHEHNFEAIILILHNCPALESVKLVHKSSLVWQKGGKGKIGDQSCRVMLMVIIVMLIVEISI